MRERSRIKIDQKNQFHKNAARRCPSEAVPERSCGGEKQTQQNFIIFAGVAVICALQRPTNIGEMAERGTALYPQWHHGERAKLTRRPPGSSVRDLWSLGGGSGVEWKQAQGAGAALGEDGIAIV